jgi:hypothetical protein
MKFLNIDLHISVIEDIITIFKIVNKDIKIEDWSLSGHTWVLNKKQTYLEELTSNWKNLDMRLINNFHNKYDTILKTFDGFICCYPVSFVLLFEKYGKPIYVINAVRYDIPFCWNNDFFMIKQLQECLIRLQDKKLLTFISNNKADDDYFKLGNYNINTKIIPSLCLYTNMIWNPEKTNNKFLLYSGTLEKQNNNIIQKNELGKYKFNTLMGFKGIIHFPYEASTMSIFEQISSCIPLFFPSKKYLKFLWENNKIHNQMNYWKHNKNGNIPNYLYSTINYDFWIDRADYYDIEGYYYFDSTEHLFNILDNFTDYLYNTRKEFLEKRKNDILIMHKI